MMAKQRQYVPKRMDGSGDFDDKPDAFAKGLGISFSPLVALGQVNGKGETRFGSGFGRD